MAEAPLSFDFGSGHTKTFISFAAFDRWLEEERQNWIWLKPNQHPNFGNIANLVQDNFSTIRHNSINAQSSKQPLAYLHTSLVNGFGPAGILRYSKSDEARRILEVKERAGEEAANFVYAFETGNVGIQSLSNAQHLLGLVISAMPDLGKPNEIAARLRRERDNYRSSITGAIDLLERERLAREEIFIDQIRHGRGIAASTIAKIRRQNRAAQRDREARTYNAILSIQDVENSYRQAMGLQAPVIYWNDKAARHLAAEQSALNKLFLYFPIAGLLFLVAFFGASWVLLGQDAVHQTVYLIVAAGLASFAALIFWVGRLLTKLYLSQQHMRHDAEERAVMTTTYLALTHENAAGDEDKKIILTSLFRPTADGLIKDDGPSELSLAGLLSRLGAGR